METMSLAARLCWALDRRRWIQGAANALAAGLFVVGCVAFYVPDWYAAGVTLFLAGSLIMLAAALGELLIRYGPST